MYDYTLKKLKKIIGKTVKDVKVGDAYPNEPELAEKIEIIFTDGTSVTFTSWDAENYESGIDISFSKKKK